MYVNLIFKKMLLLFNIVCIVLSYLNNYCSHLSCKLCEHKVCVNIILYVSVKKGLFLMVKSFALDSKLLVT